MIGIGTWERKAREEGKSIADLKEDLLSVAKMSSFRKEANRRERRGSKFCG